MSHFKVPGRDPITYFTPTEAIEYRTSGHRNIPYTFTKGKATPVYFEKDVRTFRDMSELRECDAEGNPSRAQISESKPRSEVVFDAASGRMAPRDAPTITPRGIKRQQALERLQAQKSNEESQTRPRGQTRRESRARPV